MKIIAVMILVLTFGCSEIHNLHEMKDSTKNMERTTERMANITESMSKTTESMAAPTIKMADTTGKMLSTTEEMQKKIDSLNSETMELGIKFDSLMNTTNELYDSLRQATALQVRGQAWEALLRAPTMFTKISEAGKYLMAFEVQIWNKYAQDITTEKRNILAQQAAKEFFMQIEDLAYRDGSLDLTAEPNPREIYSAENRMASFNALAITLNQYNRKQINALVDRKDISLVTMQSLIFDALNSKAQILDGKADELGTKLPYIREILAHEAKAIQILQTQVNMAPLLAIDATTGISEKGFLKKAAMTLFEWELDLAKLNPTQLDYLATEILEPAIAAKTKLQRLGYNPNLISTVTSILRHMKIKNYATTPSNQYSIEVATRFSKLLTEFQ